MVPRYWWSWAVKNVLVVRPPESAEMVERIVGYAEKARREGILSLEKPMGDEPNMLTRAGIGLVVDGTEPDLIMDILETELHHVAERHAQRQGSVPYPVQVQLGGAHAQPGDRAELKARRGARQPRQQDAKV